MRKVLIILAALLVAFSCFAQEQVYYNSTPTLVWDAVTQDADGNAFLPGDIVEYEVYGYMGADIAIQPIENLTLLGTTTSTELEITLDPRVAWYVAVRYKHTDGGGNINYSPLAYSTEEVPVTLTGPFAYFPSLEAMNLNKIQGLRDSGM